MPQLRVPAEHARELDLMHDFIRLDGDERFRVSGESAKLAKNETWHPERLPVRKRLQGRMWVSPLDSSVAV